MPSSSLCLLWVRTTKSLFARTFIIKNMKSILESTSTMESITVPGQELYGQLPGYLGKMHNSFCWVITSATVMDNEAKIAMINDFGSEDLIATLTYENDSLYRLKQIEGSTLKSPRTGNGRNCLKPWNSNANRRKIYPLVLFQ